MSVMIDIDALRKALTESDKILLASDLIHANSTPPPPDGISILLFFMGLPLSRVLHSELKPVFRDLLFAVYNMGRQEL